jgi:hypothetical protein
MRAWVLLLVAGGCIDHLDPGELGTLRYFGEVRGARPLRLLPPVVDREGNAYVLHGSREIAMVEARVGLAGGGWAGGCTIHEGDDRGVHGWVGVSADRAWYWSGEALVEVSGTSGGCGSVADRDPSSNANLSFLGVAPWVREAPSRTTLLAMVSSPADPAPFEGLVDLETGQVVDLRPFEPAEARDVVVLGTGADAGRQTGVFLVRYRLGDELVVEGVFLDAGGGRASVAWIEGGRDLGEDAVLGHLQFSGRGLVAGLLEDGDLIIFGRRQGVVRSLDLDLDVVGLHAWGGDLWLAGTDDGTPVVARLDDEGWPGELQPWTASLQAAETLAGPVHVLDDRAEPRRWVSWEEPSTAMGEFPFLSPHPPSRIAEGTAAWLVAGPSFAAGGEERTSVAFGPLGISYP